LEAFTELLKHLPADTGMGIVLVQHLDPVHESELARLLARATTMPTREVTNNLRVEPNQVYVIPPNVNMSIVKGVLKLEARAEGRKPQYGIDRFFESLAQDQRERAIGVVLSGTATDGTLGLEAIKAEGGIAFAQDDSAKYDSMPRSAVAAGCVDFVLSPMNIATELARIAQHPFVVGSKDESATSGTSEKHSRDAGERERETSTTHQDDATALPSGGHGSPAVGAKRARTEMERASPQSENAGINQILLLLRNHCGVDFSFYKSTTIQRRIARRMVLGKHGTFADYANFLRNNAAELDTLFSDVLISVTSFFRNPEAFDLLKRTVFPRLLKDRRDDAVRVWILGCSTGQEAYSDAMAYAEFSEGIPRTPKLQIFATDLNESLLDKARAGLYAKSLAVDISPERLRRFFVEEEGGYRVTKPLREIVVFARQNLISDPPFSRLDLICCRNLLIYLEPVLQKNALSTFHYALKPGGFLFLGASESVGAFTDLFAQVDKKQKVFSRKPTTMPSRPLPGIATPAEPKPKRSRSSPPSLPESMRTELGAQREADRLMVNEFAPPGVLVNADLQILQFRGPTSAYLTLPRGKASFDVLKMAHDGLMLPLRAAINKAKKDNRAVRKDNVRVDRDGDARTVNLQVIPLKNVKERCYLILFDDVARPDKSGDGESGGRHGRAGSAAAKLARAPSTVARATDRADVKALRERVAQSERELAETRDYLQAIQEEHEAASEELQAASEEAQSANEELQSINEELETSKEELESTNEELTTVNEEMGNRNVELNRLNADLNNLHLAIHTAILVLSRNLTIRRFTPLAEKLFNLLATDVGRPLGGIRHNLMAPSATSSDGNSVEDAQPLELENLIREVIDTVSVREREVQDKEGRWFSLRVRPYMTLDNKIDGAVLALVDIDALKRSEQGAGVARDFAEATIRAMPTPLVVLDGELRVKTTNEAFYRVFKVNPHDTEGRLIYELGSGRWNVPALRALLEEILPRNGYFNDFEIIHDFQGVGPRTVLLNGRRLDAYGGVPDLILLAIEDISERKQGEEALAHLAAIVESSDDAIVSKDLNGIITTWNQGATRLFGYTAQDVVGKSILILLPPERQHEESDVLRRIRQGERIEHFETVRRRKDGSHVEVALTISPIKDARGEIVGASKIARDITDSKEAEAALRESETKYRTLFDSIDEGFCIIEKVPGKKGDPLDFRYIEANPAFESQSGVGSVVGKTIRQMFPGITEEWYEIYDAVLESGEPKRFVLELYANERVLELYAFRVEDEMHRRVAVIFRDITKRRQDEEAIRHAGERFRLLAETMPQKMFTATASGNVDYFNPQWMKYTGLSLDEIRDWGWTGTIHPNDMAENTRIWKDSIATGEPFHMEHRVRSADGIYRWHISRANALKDAKGQVLMWVGSNTDIHDVKEADLRKDEFLAMLAHELRNPLAPIRNALQFLRNNSGNSEANKPAIDMLQRQVGQVVRLVDDLLDVNRISQGKINLHREKVELTAVLDHILEVARPIAEAKEQELVAALPRRPIYLNADSMRLTQILGNLLNNACKFTDKGGRIRLAAEQEGMQAVIRVQDSGIGIAADQLSRVFEMFVQVDHSLERGQGGLGLGLALAKRLVEMQDGTIEANSGGLGKGAEFVVRFPVLDVPAAGALESSSEADQRSATNAHRILVVDDNQDAADSLAMLLQFGGHDVHTAYNGIDAVAAATNLQPDVILLDIGLPGINGFEAGRQIRQQRTDRKVTLVALTGWGQDVDRRRSLEAGFDFHLVKPVEFSALEKILEAVPVADR
jgi:two-component system CheB/CheR fusion protein